MRIDERYTVKETLGQGAQADVLRVIDALSGDELALKLARSLELRRRFRREVQYLAATVHPGIVRAYHYGEHDGRPYFTMELVEGAPLASTRIDFSAASVVALQILDALACVHARGWVHRDLKPENVLVVGEGPASLVRLIDFGLLARSGSHGPASGSLPYVAPEVAQGATADGRADLYSLGVILLETLTGRHEHALAEVSQRHRTAPRISVPGIPKSFEDFVSRLLEPDPSKRFLTALEASDALVRVSGLARGPRRFAMERMVRGALCHRPQVVRRLLRRADRVKRDGGQMLVLRGPPAIGKTTFLHEMATKLSLRGARVCVGKVTGETAAPIPELQRMVGSSAPLGSPGDVARDIAYGLGGRWTVLFVDNVHLAESVAIDVLAALARRVSHFPILVVVSSEDDLDFPNVSRLVLHPLKRVGTRLLVSQRLGSPELPPQVLESIFVDSQGYPGRIEARLASLLTDGRIWVDADGFHMAAGDLPTPHENDARRRVPDLPDASMHVLRAAAVLGRRIDSEDVAYVANTSIERAERSLAEMVRLELLTPTRARRRVVYRFSERAVHTEVYRAIPHKIRRSLHDRAATVVRRHMSGDDSAEQWVEHLLKGTDDNAAVEAAMAAAERSASIFADRRAIEYYAHAFARLGRDRDPRSNQIALQLGRLFERTGELDRALDWYERASRARDPRVAVAAGLGLASIAWVRGELIVATRAVDRAKAVLPPASPDLEIAVATHRGRIYARRGELKRADVVLRDALVGAQNEGLERSHEAIGLHLEVARLARQRGQLLDAVRATRRASSIAREHGDSDAIVEANMLRAEAFLRVGGLESASKSLFTCLEQTQRRGDRFREASVHRELANIRWHSGDSDGALEHYSCGLELARAVHARPLESLLLHDVGWVRAVFGELSLALQTLKNSVAIAELAGDPRTRVKSLLGLARTELMVGRFDDARRTLSRIDDEIRAQADPPLRALVRALTLQWHAESGHTESSEDVELETPLPEDRAEGTMILLCLARALHGRPACGDLIRSVGESIEEGGLEHLRGEWLVLKARLEEPEKRLQTLAQAISVSRERRMRLVEIEALQLDGEARADRDERAVSLTCAMERLRDVASRLEGADARALLAKPSMRALRDQFRHEMKESLPARSR